MCLLSAPGPGSYRIFSEFGIYESKYAREEEIKYAKTEANFHTTNNSKEKRGLDSNGAGSISFINTDYSERKK